VREEIARAKYIPESDLDRFAQVESHVVSQVDELRQKHGRQTTG
jgi:hypothetical protein